MNNKLLFKTGNMFVLFGFLSYVYYFITDLGDVGLINSLTIHPLTETLYWFGFLCYFIIIYKVMKLFCLTVGIESISVMSVPTKNATPQDVAEYSETISEISKEFIGQTKSETKITFKEKEEEKKE